MKQFDVVALGELLIDFTESGLSPQGNPLLEVNPGGAPCNVLSELTKLGRKTAFIGKIGDDMFGHRLKEAVSSVGIDIRNLKEDKDVRTTLAFVHTLPGGDREFSFYRNPGADMMLTEDDLDMDLLADCSIFHFGTLSMTHEGCRAATKKAVEAAKAAGAVISFDPNLREPLWESLDLMREQVLYGLSQCQILKISDNEIVWLTGEEDYDKGIAKLRAEYDIPLILLSMGKDGSRAYNGDRCVTVPAFVQEKTIETTGAGDTFCACVLYHVLKFGWHGYSEDELKEMLTFANAAASIITTRKGALYVMPEMEEIQAMINNH